MSTLVIKHYNTDTSVADEYNNINAHCDDDTSITDEHDNDSIDSAKGEVDRRPSEVLTSSAATVLTLLLLTILRSAHDDKELHSLVNKEKE